MKFLLAVVYLSTRIYHGSSFSLHPPTFSTIQRMGMKIPDMANYELTRGNTQLFNEKNEDGETDEEGEELQSAALEWAKNQEQEFKKDEFITAEPNTDTDTDTDTETDADPVVEETSETSNTKKKFVVVGGGWGGWGSAKTLCQSGVDAEVILIDALPDPTGVSFLVK